MCEGSVSCLFLLLQLLLLQLLQLLWWMLLLPLQLQLLFAQSALLVPQYDLRVLGGPPCL